MATSYREPGTLITKNPNNQVTPNVLTTQRFPMFIALGRTIKTILNEAVIRGSTDNPTNPSAAPTNGLDQLANPAVSVIGVGSQPGLRDYISGIDYVVTDGGIDWGPVITRNVTNENSTPIDNSYEVIVTRPFASTVSRVQNFSAFLSAEALVIGVNASFQNIVNTITITLSKQNLSNSLGNGIGTESDNSLVFRNDGNGRFLSVNRIPFSQAFTVDGQWKVDTVNGIIISYSASDSTLASGLEVDYFYTETYDVTGAAVNLTRTGFILDSGNNTGKALLLATDFLQVDYVSVQDGREPVPGATYYVSYTALKAASEIVPIFYGPNDVNKFVAEQGSEEEYLTAGNQAALIGSVMYSLGTAGFWISQVRADNNTEWAAAINRTSDLNYQDLVIMTADQDVKELARSKTLERSAPKRKHRTIGWFSSAPGQVGGVDPSETGNTILVELDFLRNERIVYTGTKRKTQSLLIDISMDNGSVTSNVSVPVYWANVGLVAKQNAFSSPSDSLLRQVLTRFRVDPETEEYTNDEANILAGSGVLLLEDNLGQLRVRDDVTTVSAFGTPDEAELSVRTAEDALIERVVEPNMDKALIGLKLKDRAFVESRASEILSSTLTFAVAQDLIASGSPKTVRINPDDPRELLFDFSWVPIFTLKRLTGTYSISLS